MIRKWDGTSWLVWIVTDATVPSIGDAAWGGYMAGIIDTTGLGSSAARTRRRSACDTC